MVTGRPMTHIIFGAGGAISNVLSRELIARGESVRLASRRGREVPGAESVRVDLLDPVSVQKAARATLDFFTASQRRLSPATQVAGGDSYGSRWCERQRATTGYWGDVRISTPAGVAEGFGMPSTPRPLTGSNLELHMDTGGRSLRSHHRLPYEPPPAAFSPTPSSLVSRHPQNLRAPRRFSELVVQRDGRRAGMSVATACST